MNQILHNRRQWLSMLCGGLVSSLTPGCRAADLNRNSSSGTSSAVIAEPLNVNPRDILKRVIPSSGEKLPAIGLGTWQTFDAGTSEAERAPLGEVLQMLVKFGGSMIDSSPMYGQSERVVGDLTAQLQIRDRLFLATKVWTQGQQAGIDQMEQSARLLKAKTIDLMQIHNLMDWQIHLRTLRDWKAKGKIRYLGITHYTVSAYPDLERILRSEPVDFVQFNYSILTREAESRLLPLAAEKGVAVIINRALESGSLFGRVKGKPLPAWAAEIDCASWGQFFLKYVVSHPAVTCVISGTSKPHHMKDNLGAAFGKLPDEPTRRKMVELISTL
ncbi:MAG: aldo/keto reductase [Acidobacteria bacterium]|nr:aldo/keto reductase [Acidobacteriota bacterium]